MDAVKNKKRHIARLRLAAVLAAAAALVLGAVFLRLRQRANAVPPAQVLAEFCDGLDAMNAERLSAAMALARETTHKLLLQY